MAIAIANGASDAAKYVANMFRSLHRNQHWRLRGLLQMESGSTMKKPWVEGVRDNKFNKNLAYCNADRILHTSLQGIVAAGLRQLQ